MNANKKPVFIGSFGSQNMSYKNGSKWGSASAVVVSKSGIVTLTELPTTSHN